MNDGAFFGLLLYLTALQPPWSQTCGPKSSSCALRSRTTTGSSTNTATWPSGQRPSAVTPAISCCV